MLCVTAKWMKMEMCVVHVIDKWNKMEMCVVHLIDKWMKMEMCVVSTDRAGLGDTDAGSHY